MAEIGNNKNHDQRCLVCGIETTRHCDRCVDAYFCNTECETRGWSSHENNCSEFELPALPSCSPTDENDGDDNNNNNNNNTDALHAYLTIASDAGAEGHHVRESILLRRILAVDDRQPGVHYSLAVACGELGNPSGAVEILGTAAWLLLDNAATGGGDSNNDNDHPQTESGTETDPWFVLAERVVAESLHWVSAAAARERLEADGDHPREEEEQVAENHALALALMHRAVALASRLGDRSLESEAAFATATLLLEGRSSDASAGDAVEFLKRADTCRQQANDGDGNGNDNRRCRRHLRALELVPLVLAGRAVSAETIAERDELLEASTAEARVALAAATATEDDNNENDDCDDETRGCLKLLVAKTIMNELALKQLDPSKDPGSREKFRELQSLYQSAARDAERLDSTRLRNGCEELRRHLEPV
eukprot:jgi/Psemu1/4974/gm1.4974_g